MSTQPRIRVICDSKRSASCRDYMDTGSIQTTNARIIARHEGWDTIPEEPMRDICPACVRELRAERDRIQRGGAS